MDLRLLECEGYIVRVVGEGINARYVCDCLEYHTPTRYTAYNSCRHVIIVAGRLAGHQVKLPPATRTATVLEFRRRLAIDQTE